MLQKNGEQEHRGHEMWKNVDQEVSGMGQHVWKGQLRIGETKEA